MSAFRSVVEASELPQVVRLEENLYGVCFSLMKQLPARFILDRARDAGLIKRGSTIIETSSGTFALALATVCALRGYRLIIVSDPVIDRALKDRLVDLGARVEIVTTPSKTGGYQGARLERMAQIRASIPDAFWPCQYDNEQNPAAYAPCATTIVEAVRHCDYLVGTVGSGGSTCGTAGFLRLLFPQLRLVGIDTHGSILFGHEDRSRALRGLGNSLMPKNLDHRDFDEVHWVGAAEAYMATREMHRRHALYMGGTSGAAYLVAKWIAAASRNKVVVSIFPDLGFRYQSTIYNDEWLSQEGLVLKKLPEAPVTVSHPLKAKGGWSRIDWGRRSLDEVMEGAVRETAV